MKIFKKMYNIDELNAIKTQYEEPIRKKEILLFGLIPAFYIFVLLYSLYYNFKLSLAFSLLGAAYGILFVMPKMISRNNYSRSQRERNRFMNSLTQNLVNDNVLTVDGIERVSGRIGGEFSKDIKVLIAHLKSSNEADVNAAYETLVDKYRNDRVFVQYIDQLNTATSEGRNNIDELDSLSNHHDLVLQKQRQFYKVKDQKLTWYAVASILVVAIALTLAITTWNLGYNQVFIKTPVGWFIGGIFIIFNLAYTHKFVVDYFDDEIMEVKK